MVTFIQKTNRNSFTLKYKKYKRLRSDVWGHIAFVNKQNAFTTQMMRFAEQEFKNRIRTYTKRKKKQIYRSFGLTRGFYKPFEYSVTTKAGPKQPKKLTLRGATLILRKKIKAFYYLRLRRKSLRKLFKRKLSKACLFNIPTKQSTVTPYKFIASDIAKGSTGATLESRIDVVLYRLNFISSIYDGRRLIRTKGAFVLGPCTRKRSYRKFFKFFLLRKNYYKVPLFYFVSLRYDLTLYRKMILLNLLHAAKLVSYPPSYFMVSYKTMIGLRLTNPPVHRVRYPFYGTLAFFIGTALYF
jgi:ribosomal protein S4